MKVVIYVRTSTTEQHPEKQLKDCREFCKDRGYEVQGEYIEKLSAYKKETKRPVYDQVKELARNGLIKGVVVWAFDRWVRNRDTLLEDVTVLRMYGCKLHAVRDSWIEAINIEGPLGATLQDFMLGLIGSIAEMESIRKSDRTKMAYENRKGRWGRKNLPKRVVEEVLSLYKSGKSMRWIAKNVFYYDKNKNKKNMSIGSVHKIISNSE